MLASRQKWFRKLALMSEEQLHADYENLRKKVCRLEKWRVPAFFLFFGYTCSFPLILLFVEKYFGALNIWLSFPPFFTLATSWALICVALDMYKPQLDALKPLSEQGHVCEECLSLVTMSVQAAAWRDSALTSARQLRVFDYQMMQHLAAPALKAAKNEKLAQARLHEFAVRHKNCAALHKVSS